MAKQLNVDMRFNADTSKAKQSIQELQQQLAKLGNINNFTPHQGLGIRKELQEATLAAKQLGIQIDNSIGKDGLLDFAKFNQELQKSGQSLSSYGQKLSTLGAAGKQAFIALTQQLSQANISLQRTNGLVSTMWTTLKNVARFQISSSIMHTFVGGLQTAYGYAQDLNESLNNIRIVTGQSVDQMARFAEQANKTARSLSASTLDYTNASLIYYQQGLDDAAVRERTDVTVKMANVTRESAETVSEQMTAIWNNFKDGSKSLEYYADVITALGAATASSSSEISQGLEKFAAVADTVGLSYENATAALATITATTRQSADTVGTGLRTLFSRLQGLSLGETLEDGVDLNKYSKALETVGVHALDASGNLRRMDDVLEDLGERWGQLSNAQQTALAQTVGGVRQYTTLVALMDNWDFMKQNQEVAANATGTLQEQLEIYQESWEAARKEVQTAAQSIYDTLVDEKLFIGIEKGFSKILDSVSLLIQSFGGLPGILSVISSLIFSLFGPQMASSVDNLINNIKTKIGLTTLELEKQRQEAIDILDTFAQQDTKIGFIYQLEHDVEQELLDQTRNKKELSDLEAKQLAQLQDEFHVQADITKELVAQNQESTKNYRYEQRKIKNTFETRDATKQYKAFEGISTKLNEQSAKLTMSNYINNLNSQYSTKTIQGINPAQMEDLKKQLLQIKQVSEDTGLTISEKLLTKINQLLKTDNLEEFKTQYLGFMSDARGSANLFSINIEKNLLHIQKIFLEVFGEKRGNELFKEFEAKFHNLQDTQENYVNNTSKLYTARDIIYDFIQQTKGNIATLGQAFTGLMQGLSSLAMAYNGLKGIVDIWNDDDVSTIQKIITSVTTLSSVTMSLSHAYKALSKIKIEDIKTSLSKLKVGISEIAQNYLATTSKGGETTVRWANVVAMAAEKSALLGLLAAAAPYLLAIGAIIAAIALLVKHQKQLEDQKPEKVFERTQKAVEDTTTALNECKQKVEDIHNAFDKYNEITKRLSEVKTGTEEWNAALKESNEEILALLEKYPELKEFLHRDATTGRFTIDQDAVNEQLEAELNTKLRNNYNARIMNNNAEVAVAKSELPDIEDYGWSSSAIRDVFLEAIEKGYATGLEEDNQRIKDMLREQGIFNTNQDYYDNNGNLIERGQITDVYDRLIDALLENKKAYGDYTKVLSANTEQNESWAEEMGKTFADTIGASAWMQNNGLNKELGQKYLDEYNAEAEKHTDKQALSQEYLDLLDIDATKTKWDGANFQYKTEDSDKWEKIPWEEVLSNVVDAVISEDFNASEYAQAFAQDLYERSGFNSLAETANLNDSQKQIFENLLGTIDWSSPTEGLEQLKEKLSLLGISIPEEALQAFIDKLLDVNDAANGLDLDNSDTAYREMTEAESDYKQKQETYNTLKERGYSTEDAGKELEEAAERYLNSIDKYNDAVKKERAAHKELLDLDEDQLKAISTYITKNADKVEDLDDDLKDNADAVEDVAIAWLRFERAAEAAAKSGEDWKEALSSDSIREQTIAMGEMANTYGDLLDMDGSVLSEDFLKNTENLDLMLEAIQGNGEAYDELVRRATEDQIKANIDWTNLEEGTNKFNEIIALRDSAMEALSSMEVGPIDDTNFIASLEQMINDLGLSVEEATNLLGSMGVDAQIENATERTEDSSQTNDIVPEIEREGNWTVPVVAGNGSIVRRPVPLEGVKFKAVPNEPTKTVSSKTATALKITSATKTSGGNIKYNNTKHFTPSSGKGSGGKGSSGSKSKSSAPKTAEDRYHDTLNRREKTKNAFDKAQNEKEELWGQARIKKWKEAQKALEDYIKAQQDLLKDTERWLKTDKKALQDALSKINVTITPQFDENGTITNYEAILGQINNLYQKYNGNDEMIALIEAAQKALEQYDKTSDLWIDRKKELDDLNKQLDKLRKEEQIEQKERERYHRIERELAENDRKLEEERRERERAYGEERLTYLREEQQLLQKRQKLYEQYLAEIETDRKYIDQDRNDLIEAFSVLGLNVEFDENGEIANIEELFDKVHAAWESGDNSMFGTDLEEAKKRWDKLPETIKRYEDTLDSLYETEQKLAEVTDELLDNILELVTTQVELHIEISDRDLKRIEYALKHIEDDVYKTAEALALLGRQGDVAMNKIAAYEQGIADILNISLEEFQTLSDSDLQTLLSNLNANAITQVEEYCDALREQKTELMELQKTIVDKVLSAYDELNEKVDEAYDRFSQFSDLLSSYNEIVELSAGVFGPLTDQIQDFIRATNISNAQNQTTAARERLAAAQADLAAYSGDNEEILKRLQEAVRSANEAFLSSIQETLQALQEAYENAFNDIFDNLDKWVDNAEKAYGRQKELNEEYLTDYEKTYQLNKLSRDLDKTLNNTNSAKGRARLLELQKEINDGMADANRLSAYDVEFLQKKLALEQARLDLENARNAKSYMQLQRGADGQWGYVYTADEEAVEQAEQAYEDRQHDLYELQKRQEASLTDQLHSLAQSRAQAMRDLESNRKDMTEEEYQAERAALENHFQERARYMFEQMGNLFDNNNWADQLYNMGLALGISESTLSSIVEHDDLGEAMALFLNHFGDAQAQSDEEYAQYISAVKNFLSSNDVTVETLQAAIENIGFGSLENVDNVIAASADLSTTFAHSMDVANEELNKLQQAIDSVTDSLDPFIDRLYGVMTILEGGTPINLSDIDLTPSDKITPSPMPIGLLNPGYSVMPTPISNPSDIDVGQVLQALSYINGDSMSSVGENFLRSVMPRLPDFLTSMLEQNVQITASFPSVIDHNEIEEAFNNLINKATQYANRKNMRSITFGDSYNS